MPQITNDAEINCWLTEQLKKITIDFTESRRPFII